MVPNFMAVPSSIQINSNDRTLIDAITFTWEEPLDNSDSITSYSVSCTGAATCPPDFTTPDNTVQEYTVNGLLNAGIDYTFSIVATNQLGNGPAATFLITGLVGMSAH